MSLVPVAAIDLAWEGRMRGLRPLGLGWQVPRVVSGRRVVDRVVGHETEGEGDESNGGDDALLHNDPNAGEAK